jgi:maleylacetate reductase
MRPFTYDALPGRVVFAPGAFDRAADELSRLGVRRALLIADRSGAVWAERLRGSLGPAIAATIDDVVPHVPFERAEAARELARRLDADAIITLGGGSATGLGKAVALELPVPILAIPTTYAGSEMTPIWGLTTSARKETGRDPRVLPRTVIYDPVLTLSLPPSIAGPSGINAMAHCAEALYADGANPVTSLMAEEGIRVLRDGLPRVVATPQDIDARSQVLAGAYLAGACFAAAGSGIHHKICHVLGGAYDLPHAEMHTVILPHALAFNAPAVPVAMARMAAALGDADVPAAIYDLAASMGAATSLAAIGMRDTDIPAAAALIVAAAPRNPRPVTVPAITSLLTDAYHGRRPSLGVMGERLVGG